MAVLPVARWVAPALDRWADLTPEARRADAEAEALAADFEVYRVYREGVL